MTTWNRMETKSLVENSYGKLQAELAYQSMCSTIDRQEYARYHYLNAKNLFDAYVGQLDAPWNFLKISTGGCSEEAHDEFIKCFWEIGAHVTACIQSLHAMGDIFAHTIYYALGYKLELTKKGEQKLYLSDVRKKLSQSADYRSLVQELNLLTSGGDFTYLGALANHCKHRSLIRPLPWGYLKGIELEFQEFTFDKNRYSRRLVLPFLQSEFDRQSLRIFEAGNVLNSILKSDSSRARS